MPSVLCRQRAQFVEAVLRVAQQPLSKNLHAGITLANTEHTQPAAGTGVLSHLDSAHIFSSHFMHVVRCEFAALFVEMLIQLHKTPSVTGKMLQCVAAPHLLHALQMVQRRLQITDQAQQQVSQPRRLELWRAFFVFFF